MLVEKEEMVKRARLALGSVVFNRKQQAWNFLWVEKGKRRSTLIGHANLTREQALKEAEPLRRRLGPIEGCPTVRDVVKDYRQHKMPERESTRRGYEIWLENHILHQSGATIL